MHESMHLHAKILLYGHSTVSDRSPPSISGVTLRARFGAKLGTNFASKKDEYTGANIEGGDRSEKGAQGLRFLG